jgi:hypothetical protein
MSDGMIRFTVRTANVPNAVSGSTAVHRCWWVAGINQDGMPVAGFLPRDEVTDEDVKSPMQLIGMEVEGHPAAHQKRPGSIWISYLRPVDYDAEEVDLRDVVSPVDDQDDGAIATLHRAAGDASYRASVRGMVADISAHLKDLSDKLSKAADAIKSIGNL